MITNIISLSWIEQGSSIGDTIVILWIQACIVCKVLESVVRDKIMDHFLTNKLFSDKQFGFLKGRSTVTQLLCIMEQWTEMLETGGRVDVLRKRFRIKPIDLVKK